MAQQRNKLGGKFHFLSSGMSAETLHAEIQSPQRRCPCSALLAAGRTKYRSVVLGKDLILGSVWEHIDEVVQVPQSVSQGPYGEISRGERLQIPEVSVRCKRDKSFQAALTKGSWSWGCGKDC